ncbi:DNA-binding CsgD family transcriptional regulator [Paraburkholderia bannensis]|uniref:DNA-binding CsgD family transcriptional regulator n=1 Tax=Paraburkholderia bannensis TaxID=765414 RepID=A0A7W9WVG4_9BURK|nr:MULTISPECIES: helix-turn-helix transcriptional regulator [Paraburkholderia]MBB3260121.1 DNA-binding CsgD family transcriptional regulator [Paraburkholderia sp. WP4_3_2]MBB6105327.1 DNA-binding CsgD family transcriptional regulator [Paraburkholderia bannensis]
MPTQDRRAAALETAVATLAKLARPGATVFYRIGADQQPSSFELFGLAETMHRTWLQRYLVLDPMHPSRYLRQHGNVLTLALALPEALRGDSVYWRRFLQPHRVVDVMEVLLCDEGRVIGAFSLLRFAPDAPFTQHEIDHAGAVQPLLELALAPVLRSESAIHAAATGDDAEAPRLTHREEQIARLVRDGLSNKAIARDLALSQPTVKTHLLRMFRKLGVSSRTELIGALFL